MKAQQQRVLAQGRLRRLEKGEIVVEPNEHRNKFLVVAASTAREISR
jgi:hypothetical protein